MKVCLILIFLTFISIVNSFSQVINGDPGNYISLVSTLTPGDTLLLAAGNYTYGLTIDGLMGTSSQGIVVMGSGNSTIFLGNACCNTVSIKTSAYVTLQNFKIDGQNIPNIDGVKAEGNTGNWAHHIVLSNLLIVGHGANQQTVGISTKCTTWDWTIKDCTIDAAGTGIYLGNSNGEQPFVNGIIEYNLIKNTVGYNMEIKHQNVGSRNSSGMTLNGKTIIRHNVFSKESNSSSGGNARPNVLVGNFPASGDGTNDYYEIYGNFFWQNPTESLFQGTGNVMFYDNVCVNNAGGNGVTFQSQNGFLPKDIRVFHNTIVAGINWGIRLMDTDPATQKYVSGNAVFSDHSTPIRIVGGGVSTANLADNIEASISNANNYVNNSTSNISTIDLFPKTGSALHSTQISNSFFTTFTDFLLDFNLNFRNWEYRGAYSGEGTNTGWQLAIEKKPRPGSVSLGISEMESNKSKTEILLFPNPTNNMVYLDFGKQYENVQLTISNSSGQVVFEQLLENENKTELNTTELMDGIYYVRVESNKFSTILKLIKI